MNDVTLSSVLSTVQYIEAPTGRRLAVMDADDWIGLVEWLEEIEDRQVIRANLRECGWDQKIWALCFWRASWMSYRVWIDPPAIAEMKASSGHRFR